LRWALGLNGVASIVLGVVIIVWPNISLFSLVIVFGAFALVRGVSGLVAAFSSPIKEGRGWLILSSLAGIAVGVLVFLRTDMSALALLYVIGAYAIALGVITVSSVEPENLLERRGAAVRHAIDEQFRHCVLPARTDRLRGEIPLSAAEVVCLEIAEHLVLGAEDRVVADAGPAERGEHLGPHLAMRCDVVVDLLGLDPQDEPSALTHALPPR
jgi:hypothetical protein